jgi:hypothetical protein
LCCCCLQNGCDEENERLAVGDFAWRIRTANVLHDEWHQLSLYDDANRQTENAKKGERILLNRPELAPISPSSSCITWRLVLQIETLIADIPFFYFWHW